jgi:AcrR family transcriptional regulator
VNADRAEVDSALLAAAARAVDTTTARRGTLIRDTRTVASRLGESALRLFSTRGYGNVTIADIASDAGLTSRTFHRYYPCKEAVITDIADVTNDRLVELIRCSQQTSMLAALREAVAAWQEEFEDLFVALSRLTSESSELMAAVLLRSVTWEQHIGAALRDAFPNSSPDAARVLGCVFMSILRLAQTEATANGTSNRAETARFLALLGPVMSEDRD